ncbi:MAG: hypothetical protein DRP64_01370 [Verrucomicrobia bacterium]|nr:MAG: hypothetical protein DRP64_01370 [Verrucomicrobiota bacterium]
MDMHVEKLDFGSGLMKLEEEWVDLLLRSSRPTIYSSFDYVCTSCSHFKRNEEVFFLVLRAKEDDRLLAIFPISIWNDIAYGIPVRRIEHGITLAMTEVDKPYPIIDRDCEAECWKRFSEYLRKDFRQWDLVVYNELWPESGLNRHLRKLFPLPAYWTKTRPGPDSPIFALDGDWDAFWNAHHHVRGKNRRIEKQLGDRLSFFITSDPEDVDRCLDAYIATEQASTKTQASLMWQEKQRFYRELFPKLAEKGRLYFAMLYDRDTVIAAHVSYVFDDRVYFALCTFNPEYGKFSPGLVLHFRFIQFFHGKGYSEGDFLAGYAHYLNPWASYSEKTVNIQVRKIGWKNGYVVMRHLMGKVGARCRRSVKSIADQAANEG